MAVLHFKDADGAPQSIELKGDMTLGRDPGCDIALAGKMVSRSHARITAQNNQFILEDLNSGKGTILNDRKIKKAKLKHGDLIIVGEFELQFEDRGPGSRAGKKPATKKVAQRVVEEEVAAPSPRLSRYREKNTNSGLTVALVVLIVLNVAWFFKSAVLGPPAQLPQGNQADAGSSSVKKNAPPEPEVSFEELARRFRKEGRESLAALIDYHRVILFDVTDMATRDKLRKQALALSKEKEKEDDILKKLFFILNEEMTGNRESAAESLKQLRAEYSDPQDAEWIDRFHEDLKKAYEIGARRQLNKLEALVQHYLGTRQFDLAAAELRGFGDRYPAFAGAFEIGRRLSEVERLVGGSVSELRARVDLLAKGGNYQAAIDLFRNEVVYYPADAPGLDELRAHVDDIRRLALGESLKKTAAEFVQQYEFALAADACEELADLSKPGAEREAWLDKAVRQRANAGWFAWMQLSLAKRRLGNKNKFEQDDGSVLVLVNADERGYYYHLQGASSAAADQQRRSWTQVPPRDLMDIAVRLKWSEDDHLKNVLEWCIDNNQFDAGLALALQLDNRRGLAEVAPELVARLLKTTEADGPFVIYKKEWMTEAQKKERIANAAIERKLEQERKEREKYLFKARAVWQKAQGELSADEYKKAKGTFEACAAAFPDTEYGEKAAQILKGNCYLKTNDLILSGPSDNRIDVVIMPDGYLWEDQPMFNNKVREGKTFFTNFPAIKEYVNYWNFYWMSISSNSRKIPAPGQPSDTALGSTLSGGNGLPLADRTKVLAMLRNSPVNDSLAIVFASEGGGGTGGGGIGIFGGDPGDILIHEFFGHAFTGVGDEYTRNLGQQPLTTPCINVAITDDPKLVPWAHWIEAGRERIGVFLGGNGHETGHWRPTPGQCNLADGGAFCAVCREEFLLKMYSYVNPIDEATPNTAPIEHVLKEDTEITLLPMKPLSAHLKVEFFFTRITEGDSVVADTLQYPPLACAPRNGVMDIAGGSRPRLWKRRSVELPAIYGSRVVPVLQPQADGNVRYLINLKDLKQKLVPGKYQLAARVWDTSDWVILDPMHLMEERRFWEINVVTEPTPEEPPAPDDTDESEEE